MSLAQIQSRRFAPTRSVGHAVPPIGRSHFQISTLIPAFVVACYFGRASVLEKAGVIGADELFAMASYCALGIATAWQLCDGGIKLRFVALPVLGATFTSVLLSQNRQHSLMMWAGWALLLCAVGPVFASARAIRLRKEAYRFSKVTIIAAVVMSILWLLSGAQSLGRGDFSGVMCHSLTLGPVCAIGGALAFVYYLNGRSKWWLAVFAAAGLLTLASASRASLAAFVAALITISAVKMMKDPVVLFLTLSAVIPLPLFAEPVIELAAQVLPSQYVEGFMRKGMIHTREQHWQSRWEEFEENPWCGIGFCWGREGTAGFNDETKRIETGSSYIAVISMTGVVGAIGLSSVIVAIMCALFAKWNRTPLPLRLEIVALATVWAVHLGAEGYIFATGSVFTVCFWLWCAWALDSLSSIQTNTVNEFRPSSRGTGASCR